MLRNVYRLVSMIALAFTERYYGKVEETELDAHWRSLPPMPSIGVVAAADPEQRRKEAQRFSASRTQDNRGRRRKADGHRIEICPRSHHYAGELLFSWVGLLGRARRSGHQCRGLSRLTAARELG
jgi:hypothetical protein